MDEMIADQIEWILSGNAGTNRLGRQIVTLAGFLADGDMPGKIDSQMADLSRQITLQDMFDALIQSLNTISKSHGSINKSLDASKSEVPELGKLLDQIEAVRKEIAACPTVNYASLISWLVIQAREKKVLNKRARR